MVEAKRQSGKLRAAVGIVVLSALAGVLADWRAPGIGRYANDWLMRQRGPLPVPSDIAIVAIDEKSIRAYGRFPWSRQILARTIDALRGSEAKAIAVDVLFPDPTTPEADEALARSVANAGNVVLGAQLVDSPASWLMPMPALARASAGLGHVNVQVEADGSARQIAAQASDDEGKTLRAIAIEAVRVGDRTPEQSVSFTRGALLVGERVIPLESSSPPVVLGQLGSRAPVPLGTGRMTIDYIGPAGSFEPVTYSVVDVLENRLPASSFRNKYVLIGATAASQGDRVASPFLHRSDARADQHGVLMPGVEVLANALNTILRARFYSETGAFGAFFWPALIAALTLLALDRAQGRPEILRQAVALFLAGAATVLAGYLEFTGLMIFPPLTPALFSFASAGILGLMWRSLAASARLDESIQQLLVSSEFLAPAKESPKGLLPHGLEWKARQVGQLNSRLMERSRFVDQALRSVEDGLIIAGAEGRIILANRSAGAMLQTDPRALAGQNLFERLDLTDADLLKRLVVDRARVEREIVLRESLSRRYFLRMTAVTGGDDGTGPVSGIVASLSDVTRQHELQQTKNDVITLVSHEMRTPLTAIQGMTELLAQYDMDAPRRKEISAAINDEVKRLTRMITKYLDITRLESGATSLHKTPVQVDALLRRVVLLLEPVAAQRGIRLELPLPHALPVLLADADLLARAVENLVSNAIKYSPGETTVSICAKPAAGGIAIRVTDEGYGIPEADLARVFEKFYRIPRVQDAGVPGTGLGLALVREVAELHGGTVSVTSKVNHSSTFTLRIPAGDGGHVASTLGGC